MYIIIIIHSDSGYIPYLVEQVEMIDLTINVTLAKYTYNARQFNSNEIENALKLVKMDYTAKSGYTVKKFKIK